MRFVISRLLGICVIVVAVLAVQHFFYDTIATNRMNAHLQMGGVTLWQDEAAAQKHLGNGKRIPTKSFGQLFHYEDHGLEVYYEDSRVVSIKTENADHSAYGIHVGSTNVEAIEILEQQRFQLFSEEQISTDNSVVIYGLAQNRLLVIYELNDGYIISITVKYSKPPKRNISL